MSSSSALRCPPPAPGRRAARAAAIGIAALACVAGPAAPGAAAAGTCPDGLRRGLAVGVNDARQWWLGSPHLPAGYPVQAHRDLARKDMVALGRANLGLRAEFNIAVIDPNADGTPDAWTLPDALLLTAAETGVDVLPLLTTRAAPRTRASRLAFARVSAAIVARYKFGAPFWSAHPTVSPRPITSVALWNEQNDASRFDGTMADYGRLVGHVWEQTQIQTPGFKIVTGGIAERSSNGYSPFRWLKVSMGHANDEIGSKVRPWSMLAGVGFHVYGWPNWSVASAMRNYDRLGRAIDRAAMDGSPKPPIWVTEFGWKFSSATRGAKNTLSNGAISARYKRFLTHVKRTGSHCGAVFGYNLRMGNSGHTLDDGFGYFATVGTLLGGDTSQRDSGDAPLRAFGQLKRLAPRCPTTKQPQLVASRVSSATASQP